MIQIEQPNSCEVCPNTKEMWDRFHTETDENGSQKDKFNLTKYKTIWMCPTCLEKEKSFENERTNPIKVEERIEQVNINAILSKAQAIDTAIQIREDIFNAETVSIIEIKNAIDSDDSIPANKKAYTLGEALADRINHYKKVIFDRNEQNISDATRQRSIQQYLNELANSFRVEEREALKLKYIDYKPNQVKISKPAAPRIKQITPAQIRPYLDSLNELLKPKGVQLDLSTVMTMCVAQKKTPEEVINGLKANFGV